MRGLCFAALQTLMYKAVRTGARPPQTIRFPRIVPLSLFKGATPTKAAICFGVS